MVTKHSSRRIFSNKAKRDLAHDMLQRYTGSEATQFRKQIILTNFDYYLKCFKMMGECHHHRGTVMSVAHSKKLDVSLIDFRIGSPSAALIAELVSVVKPKAVLFLGMCGGLHRSLKIGDFILPMAAIRDEGTSKYYMPGQVPALPAFTVQKFVSQIIIEKGFDYRTGVIHTTDYRFWEFDEEFKKILAEERVSGIDMECASLFVAGFASKVPIGALLLVSDLPLKKKGIKTRKLASQVFKKFTDLHIEIGIQAMSEIAQRGEHVQHYRW